MLNTFDQIQTFNTHNSTVFPQSQKLFCIFPFPVPLKSQELQMQMPTYKCGLEYYSKS